MGASAMAVHAGIYCRIPHRDDRDQTPVDAQELLCRKYASARRLQVSAREVFVDQRRTSWNADGARPGWAGVRAAITRGRIGALVLYAPDRLVRRQPGAVATLLDLCESKGVELHGVGDHWDLTVPDQRRAFSEKARRLAGKSANLSRASRAARTNAAAAGRSHGGGRRRYGYRPGMQALVDTEVAVVREVFDRFLAGWSLAAIKALLNDRGVPTAEGRRWTSGGVARIIDAPRYAGLQVLRGRVLRDSGGEYLPASWEPCIGVDAWERARTLRSAKASAGAAPHAGYPLAGLVCCAGCGSRMAGSIVGGYRMYICRYAKVAEGCARTIGAASLEEYVVQEALRILEEWDSARATVLPVTARRQIVGAEPSRAGFAVWHEGVVVRSAADLDGVVTGPRARDAWASTSAERRAAVLRYLFAVVRIWPKSTGRSVFDTSRVDVVANPL